MEALRDKMHTQLNMDDDNIEEDSDMVELKEHKPATQLTLQKQQSSDDIYSDDFK